MGFSMTHPINHAHYTYHHTRIEQNMQQNELNLNITHAK